MWRSWSWIWLWVRIAREQLSRLGSTLFLNILSDDGAVADLVISHHRLEGSVHSLLSLLYEFSAFVAYELFPREILQVGLSELLFHSVVPCSQYRVSFLNHEGCSSRLHRLYLDQIDCVTLLMRFIASHLKHEFDVSWPSFDHPQTF